LHNQHLFKKSLEIIRGLQGPDGGITATPVDDAYPYVYPRDAVFMTTAMNALGEFEGSKNFYRFLKGVRRPNGELFQRYNRGLPYVTNEREVDITPIVIQGVYDTFCRSGDAWFLDEMWGLVQECVAFTRSAIDSDVGLVYTINSIHENWKLEEGFEIWTNSAAVKGLLDASRIAGALGRRDEELAWARSSKRLLGRMLEKLYDEASGTFIKVLQTTGDSITAPDMSQLAPFYFGIYRDDDMLARTLEDLRGSLWNRGIGGFARFRDFEIVDDWHWYTGGTAAVWPLFTIWAARFYAELGITEGEDASLEFLESVVTQDLFIPEKVAPVERYNEWRSNELEFNDRIVNGMRKIEENAHTIRAPGYVCWACPLGWAHAEYVLLEKPVRRRDYELLQQETSSILK
jgi:GH15 family glucan-1,4-alpha-glucosidase